MGEHVLPAPVSPVIAFRPSPNRSSARSISSRFSIRSSCSTRRSSDGGGRIPPASGAACGGSPARAPLGPASADEVAGADERRSRGRRRRGRGCAAIRRISLKPPTKASSAASTRLALARRRLRHGRCDAAGGDRLARSRGGALRELGQFELDPRLEDRAEAATPVAIPTWRKVLLIPERHPAFGGRDDPDRGRGDRRVGHADPDPGDEEARPAASVHVESTSTPCISSRPTPTSPRPDAEEDPHRAPGSRAGPRSGRRRTRAR